MAKKLQIGNQNLQYLFTLKDSDTTLTSCFTVQSGAISLYRCSYSLGWTSRPATAHDVCDGRTRYNSYNEITLCTLVSGQGSSVHSQTLPTILYRPKPFGGKLVTGFVPTYPSFAEL